MILLQTETPLSQCFRSPPSQRFYYTHCSNLEGCNDSPTDRDPSLTVFQKPLHHKILLYSLQQAAILKAVMILLQTETPLSQCSPSQRFYLKAVMTPTDRDPSLTVFQKPLHHKDFTILTAAILKAVMILLQTETPLSQCFRSLSITKILLYSLQQS